MEAFIICFFIQSMLQYKDRFKLSYNCKFWTAGAPPPPIVIKEFTKETNTQVQCCYGMTETWGPVAAHISYDYNEDDIDTNMNSEMLTKKERDVILLTGNPVLDSLTVVDPNISPLQEVPCDGKTIGEVVFRGNVVMMGYLANEKATEETFRDGYLLSGDLGVAHPDGRIEIKVIQK